MSVALIPRRVLRFRNVELRRKFRVAVVVADLKSVCLVSLRLLLLTDRGSRTPVQLVRTEVVLLMTRTCWPMAVGSVPTGPCSG